MTVASGAATLPSTAMAMVTSTVVMCGVMSGATCSIAMAMVTSIAATCGVMIGATSSTAMATVTSIAATSALAAIATRASTTATRAMSTATPAATCRRATRRHRSASIHTPGCLSDWGHFSSPSAGMKCPRSFSGASPVAIDNHPMRGKDDDITMS